jgi:FSR family fosmidomycin resistance protein-like MFS transporter
LGEKPETADFFPTENRPTRSKKDVLAEEELNGRTFLTTTSIGHFVNDGSLQLVPLAFPVWASLYHLSNLQLSLIPGMLSLVSLPSAPFIGRLSDRTKRPGPLMVIGLLVSSLGVLSLGITALIPSSSNLPQYLLLLASAGVIGFGSGFYHPLAASVLQTAYSPKTRGRMMGINGAFGGIGSATYPLLFGLLIVTIFLSGTLLVFGVVGIVGGVIARLLITNAHTSQNANDGRLPAKTGFERDSNKKNPSQSETSNARLVSKVVLRAVYVLAVVAFLRSLTGQGIFNFLPTFLHDNRNYTVSEAAVLVGIIYIVATLGQLGWGYLSDKLGRRFALGTSTFGVGASFLLYLLLPGNSDAAIAALMLFGVFTYSGFPLLLALSGEVVGKESIGMANSIVWGVGVVAGSTVGPLLIGVLSSAFVLGSLNQALFVICMPGMFSAFLMFFVPRPVRK